MNGFIWISFQSKQVFSTKIRLHFGFDRFISFKRWKIDDISRIEEPIEAIVVSIDAIFKQSELPKFFIQLVKSCLSYPKNNIPYEKFNSSKDFYKSWYSNILRIIDN